MEHEAWSMQHGTWNVERETRNAERGTWDVKFGTWNVKRGTWNVERGMSIWKLPQITVTEFTPKISWRSCENCFGANRFRVIV